MELVENYSKVASAGIALIVGVATVCLAYRTLLNRRKENEPPLDVGVLPFVGHGLAFSSDLSGFLKGMREKHGSIFTCIIFGKRMTFISDIKAIRKIWAHPKQFNFDDFGITADSLLSGLPLKETIESGVGSHTLREGYPKIRGSENLEILQKRFQEGLKYFDNHPLFSNTSSWKELDLLEISGTILYVAGGKSLFSQDWLKTKDLNDPLESFRDFQVFAKDAPKLMGGVPEIFLKRAVAARERIVKNLILPLVVNHEKGSWHPMTDNYVLELKKVYQSNMKISHRLLSTLFAFMENSLLTLFWTLAHFLRLPANAQDEIRQEVLLSKKESSTYAEYRKNIPMLNSLITEVFRLHGDPVSFRVCTENCTVDGLREEPTAFRQGDFLYGLSSVDQLKPNVDVSSANPGKFEAARWRKYGKDPSLQNLPLPVPRHQVLETFGGGKHMCPGRFFAILEVHEVLAWMMVTLHIDHYSLHAL
uniref:Cytochrome P450 n=1 Tax=Aplanochytrium stocchinoi TaxID=215587 RepID=A0A7S3LHC0_9STRA|mmetsp:Transcript_17110/g.20603  ORF Transcript_17110/g.20603 Transcript_17110/m.20603 type:complete len:477 (-) Transcript_17110:613-2043(-)